MSRPLYKCPRVASNDGWGYTVPRSRKDRAWVDLEKSKPVYAWGNYFKKWGAAALAVFLIVYLFI